MLPPESEFEKDYAHIVELRRKLNIDDFSSLADVGMEGHWVTPYQKISCSKTGPIFVAKFWFHAAGIAEYKSTLLRLGYLPYLPFNEVMDGAMKNLRLCRSDFYLTQAFLGIPKNKDHEPGPEHYRQSFREVTEHELKMLTRNTSRKVIALGREPEKYCNEFGINCDYAPGPGARKSKNAQINELTAALEKILA